MKTSYYARVKAGEGAIAISLKPPSKKYLHYPKLAPSPALLKTFKCPNAAIFYHPIERYYTHEFFDQLFELDAQTVWNELHELANGHEPILLCYEGKGKFCHRHLVASWLKAELGATVEELAGNQTSLALF